MSDTPNQPHGPHRAGGAPLPQPSTPKSRTGRSDVVPTFLRFSNLLNISLPIFTSDDVDSPSPTKRSGTIGHDILNNIQYLFFQERETLDRVLLELQACRPLVAQQSDPLQVVLDKLTDAARDVKTRKTPKTAGRRINTYATRPDQCQKPDECDAPPSPTLQVKHNVVANPVGAMPPPPAPPAVRFQHGLPTPNTSFTSTTKTSSFTSDRAMTTSTTSSLPLLQASTAPESTCPDDETATQATEYSLASIASEQAAELESIAMTNDVGIESRAPVPKLFLDRSPANLAHQAETKSSKAPLASSLAQDAPPSLTRPATFVHGTGASTPKLSGPNYALPCVDPPREVSTSPTKPQHYRVARILQDGLTPLELPRWCASKPLHLQAAIYSFMREAKLSSEQLSKAWGPPRSLDTLSDLAKQYNVSTRPQDWLPGYGSATFAAKWEMSRTKDGSVLDLTLHPPRRELSCSLQRKFGSDRFLIVDLPAFDEGKLPERLQGQSSNIFDRVREMLAMDHSFLGRTWAHLLIQRKKSKRSADNQLDLSESGTSQVWFFAVSGHALTDISVAEVLNWAIPFAYNADQPACKAWARLDLVASRTTPTVVFRPQQIMYDVEDQLSDSVPDDDTSNDITLRWTRGSGKRIVMSDGCSMISVGAMKIVQQALRLDYLPSAVQARILGAKGMWYMSSGSPADGLSPDDIWIKIAKSQIKARHAISDAADDAELMTLNIVNWSRKARSSILYTGFLPILRDRGVPSEIVLSMAREQLNLDTQRFINALSKPTDLHEWIFNQKSLVSMRRHNDKIQTNEVAGFPTVSDERAVMMLEAGFEPCQNAYLRYEVLEIAKHVFSLKAKHFKVRLPASTSVYGICDPTGILMPGEAHLFLSEPIRDEETGEVWSNLDGNEVLVSRNPSRRNSDIQKIRLVYRTELAHLRDVIVFSSHGPRPLASKLSGGDYDGDTFWVCWEEALVRPFRNAPAPWESEQKAAQLQYFGITQDRVKLVDIIDPRASDGQQRDLCARQWIRRSTDMRMRNEWVGVVSNLHVALTYKEGTISSPLSSLLVDLHDLIIDSDKQGYIYSEKAFSDWKVRVGMPKGLPKPAHAQFTGRREKGITLETSTATKKNPQDVADRMYFDIVKPGIDRAMERARLAINDASPHDGDLCKLFNQLSTLQSAVIKREVAALKRALDNVGQRYARASRNYHSDKLGSQGRASKNPVWAEQIEEVRDLYLKIRPVDPDNEMIQQWQLDIGEKYTMWDMIKASALAKLQAGSTGGQMFKIAGRELCRLKAQRQQSTRIIRSDVYLNMKPHKRRREDDEALAADFEDRFHQDDSDEAFEIGSSLFDDLDLETVETILQHNRSDRKRKSKNIDAAPRMPPARRSSRSSAVRSYQASRVEQESINATSVAPNNELPSSPSPYLSNEQATSEKRTERRKWQKRNK